MVSYGSMQRNFLLSFFLINCIIKFHHHKCTSMKVEVLHSAKKWLHFKYEILYDLFNKEHFQFHFSFFTSLNVNICFYFSRTSKDFEALNKFQKGQHGIFLLVLLCSLKYRNVFLNKYGVIYT